MREKQPIVPASSLEPKASTRIVQSTQIRLGQLSEPPNSGSGLLTVPQFISIKEPNNTTAEKL